MSWESTAVYCGLINEGVRRRLGGLTHAERAVTLALGRDELPPTLAASSPAS
jgi:aspartate/glutamate racemase